MITLYDYPRSSAAFRVRIGLHIKHIDFESIEIHLLEDGGKQHSEQYRNINPQELVPTMEHNGFRLSQSLAILHYLETLQPNPPFLPDDPNERFLCESFALSIACDIHPLNNLRVLQYLEKTFGASEAVKKQWMHTWYKPGFDALEHRLMTEGHMQSFCYGETLTMADICLIPQVFGAKRFGFDLSPYPAIESIYERALEEPAVEKAMPE